MLAVNAKGSAAPTASLTTGVEVAATLPNLASGGAAPLYERVKRHMSEAILVGEWAPGTVLPSETVLAKGFGIAVGTVRRAMSDLVAEGLLSRRRKTGTVVTGPRAPSFAALFLPVFPPASRRWHARPVEKRVLDRGGAAGFVR